MPEKPKPENVVDTLASVLPVKRSIIQECWEKAKENQRLLATCQGHVFNTDLTPTRKLGKRWQCARCGGEVDSQAKKWYELGQAHGR